MDPDRYTSYNGYIALHYTILHADMTAQGVRVVCISDTHGDHRKLKLPEARPAASWKCV